jgi:hypothetical protein
MTTYFSCLRTARMRARACVIKHPLIYGPILFTFAVNILQITKSSKGYLLFMCTYLWTDSLQICWAHTTNEHKLHGLHTYHVHAPRVRARAWVTVRLSMDGFSSNFPWTYYTSQHVAMETYLPCPSTACTRASARVRACVCERECVGARVIKRSLIFERILSKFDGDIQHIPRGYMSYLIGVWMHIQTARTSIHN